MTFFNATSQKVQSVTRQRSYYNIKANPDKPPKKENSKLKINLTQN
jgi:hypothetical protein